MYRSNHPLSRRSFSKLGLGLALPATLCAESRSTRRILLRSSWQTVNIGDIAHTPGMLALLEKHRPESEVTLWPSNVSNGVEAMLLRRFPNLKIAKTQAEKESALRECDFFLHGSGPSIVGAKEVALARELGKPYGIGGVTMTDEQIEEQRELLEGAKFVFLRDTDSMKAVQTAKIQRPFVGFGPDATFAIDIQDEAAADLVLRETSIGTGKNSCAPFLACDGLLLGNSSRFEETRSGANSGERRVRRERSCETSRSHHGLGPRDENASLVDA